MMTHWDRRHTDTPGRDLNAQILRWYVDLTPQQVRRVNAWIQRNPPPDNFTTRPEVESDRFKGIAWAWTEMPMFVAGPHERGRSVIAKAAAWILGGAWID